MAELQPQQRLREIARVTEQPEFRPLVPTMLWTIDATTGRPVSRWVLDEAQQDPTD